MQIVSIFYNLIVMTIIHIQLPSTFFHKWPACSPWVW